MLRGRGSGNSNSSGSSNNNNGKSNASRSRTPSRSRPTNGTSSSSSNREIGYEEGRNQLLGGGSSSHRSNSPSRNEVSGRYGRSVTKDREQDPTYMREKTTKLQSASLASTRNMVQLLSEAKSVSEASLSHLEEQQASLDRSETKALKTNVNAKEAREQARDLKKYGKIFAFSLPSFRKSRENKELKNAKKAVRERELQVLEAEQADRERARSEREDSSSFDRQRRQLVSNIDDKLDHIDTSSSSSSRGRFKRNGDEHTAWNANEEEIDDNLNAISGLLANLKTNATTIGSRLETQTKQIDRIHKVSDDSSAVLDHNKRALKKF